MQSISDLLFDPKHVENILIRREKEFASDFLKGLQKGFTRFTSDTGRSNQKNEAQRIYFSLIEQSDHIDKMDTVKTIHAFLKSSLEHFPHSIETFKTVCSKIKLRGVNYREKMG